MMATPADDAPGQPPRLRLADLPSCVGQVLGTSDWIEVDQACIDRFADATGDRQWLHVDPVRAAAGPFGRTIAHGFLTLALLPRMNASAFVLADARMTVNYGVDRVRFPAPVFSGSKVRGHFKLTACKPLDGADGGMHLAFEVTMEREGGDKPVCVAEALIRCFS